MALWIVLGLVVVAGVAGILAYNGLVTLQERVDGAWSNVDVQLQRRHDLIPNLVETVKGYAAHERETLEAVIQARNRAARASAPADRGAAENALNGALASLFAVSERYPGLKADQNFRDLQESLGHVEDTIQASRRRFNAQVEEFNTRVRSIPANIIAAAGGFRPREFFEVEETARNTPQVRFD